MKLRGVRAVRSRTNDKAVHVKLSIVPRGSRGGAIRVKRLNKVDVLEIQEILDAARRIRKRKRRQKISGAAQILIRRSHRPRYVLTEQAQFSVLQNSLFRVLYKNV